MLPAEYPTFEYLLPGREYLDKVISSVCLFVRLSVRALELRRMLSTSQYRRPGPRTPGPRSKGRTKLRSSKPPTFTV